MGAQNTIEIIINSKDNSTRTIGGVQNALSGLGKIAKTVVVAGFAAAAAAAAGLAAGLAYSVKEAMEAQAVQAQLDAVLRSTGGAAGVTRDMAIELADSLTKVTRFSDEAILSGENMLLTFTSIGKDIFPEATEVILDMSTALGQDLQSSAVQLGKALNDPITGVTALRRVGVQFNDAQEEMIKKMVESGDLMGAQKYILEELQKEFGGSAKAAGETFAGQLDILKNRLSNVAEAIGTALLPVLKTLMERYILPLVPKIEALAEKFGNLVTIITDAGIDSPEAWEALSALFGEEWATRIQNFVTWFGDLAGAIKDFFSGIMSGEDIVGDFANLFYALAQAFGLSEEQASGVFTAVRKIGDAISAFVTDTLIPFIQENLPKLREAFSKVKEAVGNIDWKAIGTAISGAFSAIATIMGKIDWDAIKKTFEGIALVVVEKFGEVKEWFVANWPAILEALQTAADFIMDVFGVAIQTIVDMVWPQLQQAFNEMKSALANLGLDWEAIGEVLKFLGTVVIGALALAFLGLVSVFVGTVNAIAGALTAFTSHMQSVYDRGKEIWDNFKEVWKSTVDFFKAIIDGDWQAAWDALVNGVKVAWETVQLLVDQAAELLRTQFDIISGVVGGFIDGVITFFKNLYNALVGGSIIPDLVNSIMTWFANLVTWGSEKWQALKDAIVGFVQGIYDTLLGADGLIPKTINDIITGFGDLLTRAGEKWQEIKDAIIAKAQELYDNLLGDGGKIPVLIDDIVSAFTDTDWAAVGKGIINGIASGLDALSSWLYQKAIDIAKAALDAAKRFLGIDSPSKVFMEVGANMARGMALGMVGGSKLTAAAGAEMAAAAAGASIAIEGGIHFNVPQGMNGRQLFDEFMDELSRRTRQSDLSGAWSVGG